MTSARTDPGPGRAGGDTGRAVSIILTTNRRSPFLREALDSVVNQSVEDWELIVVDDGSPDPEWLRALVGPVPGARVIHQPSRGVSQARNAACAAAAGRYVTFLDDDDYWPPSRLERQVGVLAGAPADTVGCFGDLEYVDADGKVLGSGPVADTRAARLSAGFHIGTLMVRADALFRAGLFNPFLPAAEDIDFSLRLAHVGTLVHIPETLLSYRRHDGNVTNERLVTAAYGRAVYEHYHRLSGLAGEGPTREAIARTVASLERYLAVSAARAGKALVATGDLRSGVVHGRAALGSALTACRYTARRPARKGRR